MGVPVVSLVAENFCERMGASILRTIGLTELVAKNEEMYVEIAPELVSDEVRLVTLRNSMRERMEKSPLCDAATFVRDLEAAYSQVWLHWCRS